MHQRDQNEPDSRGFEYSRRTVLKTGAAIGLASAGAGCEIKINDGGGARTEASKEEVSDLVDDGLRIVDSGLVESDPLFSDLHGSGGPTKLDPGDTVHRNYLRVAVENTLDDPISVVMVTAEVFDGDLKFLGTQSAMISSLFSGEVFEGYIPYLYQDAGAYVIRAERSSRPPNTAELADVQLSDDCLDDEQVRGTVTNNGSSTVNRLGVMARFYDGEGNVLGTGSDTITGLAANGQADFEVDVTAIIEQDVTTVESYSVTVGNYGGEQLAVR